MIQYIYTSGNKGYASFTWSFFKVTNSLSFNKENKTERGKTKKDRRQECCFSSKMVEVSKVNLIPAMNNTHKQKMWWGLACKINAETFFREPNHIWCDEDVDRSWQKLFNKTTWLTFRVTLTFGLSALQQVSHHIVFSLLWDAPAFKNGSWFLLLLLHHRTFSHWPLLHRLFHFQDTCLGPLMFSEENGY